MNVPLGHMTLNSGLHFSPDTFKPELVTLNDIAHALAQTVRYRGHAAQFYSVAEHCCHVYDFVRQSSKQHSLMSKWALFHDAAEAYIGDVPGFFKTPEFRETEEKIMAIIREALGLDEPMPDYVDWVDKAILYDEMAELFCVGAFPQLGIKIKCWTWQKAKFQFMQRAMPLIPHNG